MGQGQPPTLRSVLSYLKKRSLSSQSAGGFDDERRRLLSALLLQTSDADPRGGLKSAERLYATACRLSPVAIREALPFPEERHFEQARQLLPVAPDVVASLDPCILGYLYQFFSSDRREEAKRNVQTANKSPALDDTIAFTQLYTPTPVVDWLLAQTSGLSPERTILDPACGAGNFLLRAFDLIIEKQNQPEAATVEKILSERLHGCDIDPVALWVFCLAMAARLNSRQLKFEFGFEFGHTLNLELLPAGDTEQGEALLGTLEKDFPAGHMLTRQYAAVVGNPPYIGRKLLSRPTKERLRALYPDAHQDVCNAFISRGLQLLSDGGRLSYITQASLLYLPTYSDFRRRLIEEYRIICLVEAGAQIFPLQSGEKVNSVLLVLENDRPDGTPVTCRRLSGPETIAHDLSENGLPSSRIDQGQFLLHRGNAFNYQCPPAILQIRKSCPPLVQNADVRQGLATSNNERFVKFWWQVAQDEIGTRWFPYVKGAGGERWFAPVKTVIDWQDNGAAIKEAVAQTYPYLRGKTNWVVKNERYYFRRGLTFSLVNTKQLCIRELPAGCIFDVAGSAVFLDEADEQWMLAYLNSSLIAACAHVLNPTINYQVGDLKELPVIPFTKAQKEELAALAKICVDAKKLLADFSDCRMPASKMDLRLDRFEADLAAVQTATIILQECETAIDDLVFEAARQHCRLEPESLAPLRQLCLASAERRKPVRPPFSTAEEYARLLLRFSLYNFASGKVDADRLAEHFQGDTTRLENALGCSLMEYVCDRFTNDQLKSLHNTLRVTVQPEGSGAVRLLSNSRERARSRS